MMDIVSPLQPLSVDCSLEYELDMSMFPGWDDPMVRAQPAVMLHRSDTCICQTDPHVTLENYDDEDEFSITTDLCEIFNDLQCEVNSSEQTPVVVHDSTQTQHEEVLSIDRTLTELMCDPYLVSPMTPSPLSPVCISSTLSSYIATSSSLHDIDFLLLSPVYTLPQPTFCRKRKHDNGLEDSSAAKRLRNYGDELFSELNVSFNRNIATKVSEPDSENEMGYDYNAPVRD